MVGISNPKVLQHVSCFPVVYNNYYWPMYQLFPFQVSRHELQYCAKVMSEMNECHAA